MEGRTHCPCYSCSAPLCVGCVKVAVVKFGYYDRTGGDFEFLERCGDCYIKEKLPVVIDARTSECLIQ